MMTLHHILPLLQRFWWEYRQVWKALLVRDLMDRLLFLFAFGFGMGAIVRQMGDVSYLAFIAPGIACSSPMMTMNMAMTFGAYERFKSNNIWQSWLATPLTLRDILLAELTYANLRSLPSVFILLGLVWVMGYLPNPIAILYVLPLIMLVNYVYGAVALCFTSYTTRVMHFAYVNTLWVMPMYLFSGVFFDLSQTPLWLQTLAQAYPLTHVIAVVRPLLLGQELEIAHAAISIGVLVVIFAVAFSFALRRFKQRIME